MNTRRFALAAAAAFLFVSAAFAGSPNVVISQVYGGGGNAGATYQHDFIELFNRGTSSVTLDGWSVQYGSSAGNVGPNSTPAQITPLSGAIAPGHYVLVREAQGSGGTTPVAGDITDATPIAMAAGAGKIALVNSITPLNCGAAATPCSAAAQATIVDFVGYGSTNQFEGAGSAATLTNTTAALRLGNGCTDTDNNAADFTVGAPAPRNSSTPPAPLCSNLPPTITPPPNPITAVVQNAAPFNVSLSGNDDLSSFNWSATPGAGVSGVTVFSGQGTANVTYTVTLIANYTGTATFTASLSDNVNPTVNQTVNITVNGAPVNNPPVITPPTTDPITTVETNAPPFTVSLNGSDDNGVYNWSAIGGIGVSSVNVTGGQGTKNVTFTVTLQGGFAAVTDSTASFTVSLSDNVNAPATQQVNVKVLAPPPPANHIVISQVYGGGGNSSATYQNDYVELYNPTASPVEVSGWSLQYQAATSTGNWTGIQPLGGTIGPGEYYLVSLASGGAVGAALPAANVVGGPNAFNMSATAGKIALVSNGDALSNCPAGGLDPDLVDLVGYGSTANCREGSSTAPASSNTTSLFRKNAGQTDTDVNGADFVAGAPNPRRTAPIVEIGPFVFNTDPANNASTAPRDASITVSFSEPVNVAGQWFNISCSSGTHNDATFANTGGGATWVITPNVSFTPGEHCTVTLFAANITDQDTDDSLPNTDNLRPGDKVWSFTVATGQAAPYPSAVHLTMGNPSNAVDEVSVPNNYLMEKPTYALSYNRDKGTPNWVSWHLTNEWYGSLARLDTFRPDPAVPADWYRVQAFDFFDTGFDRGHMTPNADRDNENRIPINQETYLMSNMVPQAPDNNQGPWANLESYLRTLTDAGNELYIVSGPAGVGGTGSNGGLTTTLAGGHVTVPAYTWKVALVLPKQDGDDVARVNAATRTIAVIMPNIQGIRNDDWHIYLTTVDAVETLSGYNLFSKVPDAIQNAIEAGVDGVNPPGAGNLSVSTNEDAAKTITLEGVSPSNGALTFTVTGTPTHGSLSGSGASQTYTPAPDFNGTDSFTYTVNDGAHTSTPAKVTISVLEVNDPPAATNDSKSTDEDTPLTFSSAELTSNDSAGPANESSQSLTVTAVSATPNTHGSVSLNGSQVSYVPAANYNGPADFAYHVCDNGFTAGLSDSKCADGVVKVTVNPVDDPPVPSINVAPSASEGSPVAANAAISDVDGDTSFSYAWSVTKNGSPYATGNSPSINFVPDDNGAYVVSLIVTDGGGASGGDSKTVNVTNVAPTIASVSGPVAPIAVGSDATVTVGYRDAGTADTETATYTWDDGSSSTVNCGATCAATHTYAAAGVYGVSIVVTDDDGGSASTRFEYVVVFDPSAGFVSGGGWIDSPAGAYVVDRTLTGKATFGFVSKYQKGQSTPSGNTEFQFHAAKFNFSSSSYDWLVIAGNKAQYKGTGTVNGDGVYAFLITATDGDAKNNPGPDKFRIKIWDKINGGVVYDNVVGSSDDIDGANPQVIGGGNITISPSR